VDPKRGNTATLLIKNGTLKSGMFVVAGNCFAPVRIMEDYLGKTLKGGFSYPLQLVLLALVVFLQLAQLFTQSKAKKRLKLAVAQIIKPAIVAQVRSSLTNRTHPY
jgi:hypothetical protein